MIEAVAVATITILAVISPGADFAMVTRNSMMRSRRAGMLTSVGISLGVLVHVAYSMAGIGLLISRSILLFSAIKFAGAAYLIYLGITMLKARKIDATADASETAPLSDFAALRIGFLTNALNPKTTLFVVSLFTQVIRVDTPLLTQLGYGAFMSLAHLVWFVLVAFAFSSEAARRFVATSRHLIERAIGTILLGLGIALATASLQKA
ncbi:MAG: LysE family transporter [Propionivibrio sp.]|jgi:RhtB (resistance to homoserine/threonine) family protein|uniref:LysE family transporter n=1 Tax=Propionivibrio sp. TaxID=2212460 RepID=UPI001B7C1B60|nr:LysE family transporter [Propionivibrio sp.]MBP7204482.1 LysE family transporter [Propionivibrio sp.]